MTDSNASRPCPICKRPRDERFRPFCSKRCADVDLHHWLTGSYAIPVVEMDDDEAERLGEALDGSSSPDDRER